MNIRLREILRRAKVEDKFKPERFIGDEIPKHLASICYSIKGTTMQDLTIIEVEKVLVDNGYDANCVQKAIDKFGIEINQTIKEILQDIIEP